MEPLSSLDVTLTPLQIVRVLFVIIGIPRTTPPWFTSKSVFIVPRALLYYVFQYQELSRDGVSLRQYLFAAGVRHISNRLDDQQIQVLLLIQSNWTMNQIIKSHKNASMRECLFQTVEGQPFRAVWIVKHPYLGSSHSKVLFWLHGKFTSLIDIVEYRQC